MCRGTSLTTLALGSGDPSKLPVVELVEHPRVHSRDLLHAEVDGVEASLQAVEQQLGHPRGDGRSVAHLGQLGQVQPLAAQTLLDAEVDVVGQGAESADDVHVRHAEGAGVVVLLPDAEQRPELGAHAGFLEDLADCGDPLEKGHTFRQRRCRSHPGKTVKLLFRASQAIKAA